MLDTDHVSLDQRGHPLVHPRVHTAGRDQIAISVITVEEQLRGWLARIRSATSPQSRAIAYLRLRTAIEYFATAWLLDYSVEADLLVELLRRQGARAGTQDLRIGAIALIHGAILVTRNARDFRQVPDLVIEDWSK